MTRSNDAFVIAIAFAIVSAIAIAVGHAIASIVGAMLRLYDYELSSDCYKVRLLLSLLRVPFERIELDVYPGCEQQSAWFRAINPLGQVPVIEVESFILRDAHAILIYLAGQHDPDALWYPHAPAESQGMVMMWLAFAHALSATAAAARLHDAMFQVADIDACRRGAQAHLRVLDEHLWFAEQDGPGWLCSRDHPTIADVACFPDIMLCEEGGISRLPYPAVRRWLERVKRISGFTPMPGIFPAD